ncbi:MAG: bifunctional phosphoribosyl-AMP cyclohydrolase/phosphoribosyl-ATP diphosphatase HisIE [Clostridiales bacterium]|nr:bifunctional phosphoribosyl-AMP cyclohydrolase/phosphoribosyl-ATP diphosphatase HisIE [Clostridiales bacterium]
MLDKTIPFYHIIMRCDRVLPMEIKLAQGYRIRTYQPGDEDAWAALECAIGEFPTVEEAKAWFVPRYLTDPQMARERVFFAVSPEGEVVGTAIAWEHDPRGMGVRALHWVAVREDHQRKGLGRALCQTCLRLFRREDNSLPVWLHTQPWSWKAILLYISLGFKLQPKDTFYTYENQYAPAMETLAALVTPEQYNKIESASAQDVRSADLSAIRYDARGLVPAITQDAYTGEVLMQAYMNEESLRLTIESGYATYWSRSRQELWKKGTTSGHLQKVIRLSYDCDADSILLQVDQTGPACHTGKRSCFFNPVIDGDMPATAAILDAIEKTVADRAENPRPGSYTNYLLDKGAEKICKKVGEEATETVIAAMKGDADGLAGEAADLLYHLTVLLYQQGVSLRDVWEVLKKRHT